jgi:putative glycerol-1-phosphate prenyltransferase
MPEHLMNLLLTIQEKVLSHQKQFAVLIDPDDVTVEKTKAIIKLAEAAAVDYFFIGGSLITKNNFEEIAATIKAETAIPLLIFPGSVFQITPSADAILFLSLISGRNAEYLIGQQVQAAPHIANCGIEAIPTGYMLVESGKVTTAQYMSNTMPIPSDKPEIATTTAMAGEMLGHKLLYLDGGSGAQKPVSESIISAVKENTRVPLIVGGGMKTSAQIAQTCRAGADIVVVGNKIEESPALIADFASTIHSF